MECKNLALQLLVVALDSPIGIGKGKESIRITLGGAFILFFEQAFKDLVFQQMNLLLARKAEIWRYLRRIDV